MNKRMTYLLAALLMAQSVAPLSAQPINEQDVQYLAINQDYLGTTITTSASISVKLDKIYATEIADARAKIDFELHDIALLPEYTNQAASLHMALDAELALTSIGPNGEVTNKPVETLGSLTINDSTHFTFEFTAKNINPASIRGNSYFTFKIPGYLLTTNVNLEVPVYIEQDIVNKPTVSPDTTTPSAIYLQHNSNHSRILYTVDGSDVTLGSTPYTKDTPINLGPNDTLKIAAFIGTMPSEQVVLTYNDITSGVNNGSDSNSGSDSNNGSDSNTGSDSNNESGSNGGSDSNNGSSSNSGSDSNNGSNSNSSSNSDKDSESSVDTDSTTATEESNDESASDTTEIADTVSNTVTTLIAQQERNLTIKATEAPYGLTINNQQVELKNKLLVHNGRTLAPLRTIAEVLNIPIHYHAASKTAIIKTADKLIEFPLGYHVAIVNGEMIQIDSNDASIRSSLQDNRTYLPLRFIANQLNLNVDFDGEQIHIYSTN